MIKFSKYAIFLLGGWFGFVCALILWSLFVHSIFNSSDVALIVFIVFWIIIVGILSFYNRRHIKIASTSFVGSYLAFKGLGMLLGGFPN